MSTNAKTVADDADVGQPRIPPLQRPIQTDALAEVSPEGIRTEIDFPTFAVPNKFLNYIVQIVGYKPGTWPVIAQDKNLSPI